MHALTRAFSTVATLACAAIAQPPAFEVPAPLAARMLSGRDVRVVIVGDSISNSVRGTFFADHTDRTHFALNTGMHNVWDPVEGWRGVGVTPVGGAISSGGYSCWRGVGAYARFYDEGVAYGPRVDGSDYVDGRIGWTIDVVSHWRLAPDASATQARMTSYLYTPREQLGENNHWSEASARIGRGDLRVRHVVYTSPGVTTPESLTFTRTGNTSVRREIPAPGAGARWDWVEYPGVDAGSTWDPETQRYETSSRVDTDRAREGVTRDYYTSGTLFYDASSDGMIVMSIGQGGDNTSDHIRTPETFGQPGFYAFRERGYADDGLVSWLDAYDMTGADRTPVVLLALGTNITMPDNGGMPESIGGLTTEAYANNIRTIIARWRGVYAQRGHDPYFILLAMYDFGGSYPNLFIDTRAQWLWEVRSTDPEPERIGFVSLPATMGYLGMGFDPTWYFSSTDHHLSSAGSVRVAQILWDAFTESVCPADYNLDGVLDTSDFFDYLADFAGGNLRADLTTTSKLGSPGYGVPDGMLNGEDVFYYMRLFAAGCP